VFRAAGRLGATAGSPTSSATGPSPYAAGQGRPRRTSASRRSPRRRSTSVGGHTSREAGSSRARARFRGQQHRLSRRNSPAHFDDDGPHLPSHGRVRRRADLPHAAARPPTSYAAQVCPLSVVTHRGAAAHIRTTSGPEGPRATLRHTEMVFDAVEMARWSQGTQLEALVRRFDAGSQSTSQRTGERLAEISETECGTSSSLRDERRPVEERGLDP
jgi:hypothetical protein